MGSSFNDYYHLYDGSSTSINPLPFLEKVNSDWAQSMFSVICYRNLSIWRNWVKEREICTERMNYGYCTFQVLLVLLRTIGILEIVKYIETYKTMLNAFHPFPFTFTLSLIYFHLAMNPILVIVYKFKIRTNSQQKYDPSMQASGVRQQPTPVRKSQRLSFPQWVLPNGSDIGKGALSWRNKPHVAFFRIL